MAVVPQLANFPEFIDVKNVRHAIGHHHRGVGGRLRQAKRAGQVLRCPTAIRPGARRAGVLINVSVCPPADEAPLVVSEGKQCRPTGGRRREGQGGGGPVVTAGRGDEFAPFAVGIAMNDVPETGLVLESGEAVIGKRLVAERKIVICPFTEILPGHAPEFLDLPDLPVPSLNVVSADAVFVRDLVGDEITQLPGAAQHVFLRQRAVKVTPNLGLIIFAILRVAEQRDEHLALCAEAVRTAAVDEGVRSGVRLVRPAANAPLGVPAHKPPFAVRQFACGVPVVVRPVVVLAPQVDNHVRGEILNIDALLQCLVVLLFRQVG